jgi:hypothetical protein
LKIDDCSENTTVPLASSAFQNDQKGAGAVIFFKKKIKKEIGSPQQASSNPQSRKRNCQITDNKIQNNVKKRIFPPTQIFRRFSMS